MIIIGYPGIGRSTLADNNPNYIDLESSLFRIDGNKPDGWYIQYSQVALNLAESGKDVFISSHKEVVDYIQYLLQHNTSIKLVAIIPDKSLKEQWIDKLKTRYRLTHLIKDDKAYNYAAIHFDESVDEIVNNVDEVMLIDDINYDLVKLVESML